MKIAFKTLFVVVVFLVAAALSHQGHVHGSSPSGSVIKSGSSSSSSPPSSPSEACSATHNNPTSSTPSKSGSSSSPPPSATKSITTHSHSGASPTSSSISTSGSKSKTPPPSTTLPSTTTTHSHGHSHGSSSSSPPSTPTSSSQSKSSTASPSTTPSSPSSHCDYSDDDDDDDDYLDYTGYSSKNNSHSHHHHNHHHHHHHHHHHDRHCNKDLCLQNCTRDELLKSKVKFLYDNLIYPLNIPLLTGQSKALDNVFDQNVQGRFDPLGTFEGIMELTEYYFALGATPMGHAVSVDYIDLFADGDRVYVRVNVLFEFYDANGTVTKTANITESGRYLFSNTTDLIITTDLYIHNIAPLQDPPVQAQPYVIQQLCNYLLVTPGLCNATTDPTGYYANITDCIEFMTSIEYGTWANVASNTVTCRQFHSLLATFDPEMHCPHCGKTGGGKCIFFTYESYYDKNY